MNATFLLTLVFAQVSPPPLPQPPTLPPVVAFAKIKDGVIHINKFIAVPEQRRVLLTRTTPDGRTVQEPTLVIEPTAYTEQKIIPLAEAKASDLMGKPIPTEKLADLFKTETVVVLVPGAALEAKYRRAFRDDVVFLTVPPERKPIK